METQIVSELVELRTGVDWDTYVALNDSIETGSIRLTYHKGTLEIMTVSRGHDGSNRLISDLFSNLAEGLGIEFYNVGGTTNRDEPEQVGFEPDTAFYVTNLDFPFDDGPIIIPRDPAPDLIVEVDVSRSSMHKMAAYAAVGCREGWRFRKGQMTILALAPGRVTEVAESTVLPGVRTEHINFLLGQAKDMPRIKWAPFVREWARALRERPT